jgi:hypothetical protein
MASRRQEFKALGKWIAQLRPIGTLHTFTVKGQNGKDIALGLGGLEAGKGVVSLPPVRLTCSATHFFELMSLFDKNKISFPEVVRLKGLIMAQAERGAPKAGKSQEDA